MTGGDRGLQPAEVSKCGIYGCCKGGQESGGFPLHACSSDWPPQSADSNQAFLSPSGSTAPQPSPSCPAQLCTLTGEDGALFVTLLLANTAVEVE